MELAISDSLKTRFIRETGLAADIAELCEPVLAEQELRLVRVTLAGREKTTVQIMAERHDGSISIDDCAELSRNLSPLLDAHDPIPGGYVLEVSSPGIDRPLVRPSDFEDWAGYEAKIELKELLDGRKRFRGTLEGFEDGEVRIEVDLDQVGPTILGLPVDMIGEAKLVLNDELIREALRRSKASLKERGDSAETDGAEIDVGPDQQGPQGDD